MTNPIPSNRRHVNTNEFAAPGPHADPCRPDPSDPVPDLVVRYYNWLSGNPGGTDPRELLEVPLSSAQRQRLIEAMDDVNVVFAITSPLRSAKPDPRS